MSQKYHALYHMNSARYLARDFETPSRSHLRDSHYHTHASLGIRFNPLDRPIKYLRPSSLPHKHTIFIAFCLQSSPILFCMFLVEKRRIFRSRCTLDSGAFLPVIAKRSFCLHQILNARLAKTPSICLPEKETNLPTLTLYAMVLRSAMVFLPDDGREESTVTFSRAILSSINRCEHVSSANV